MQTQATHLDALRSALEEQFQQQTAELNELTLHSGEPEGGGYDRDTIVARIAATKQTLADITEALQRIDDGTYGRCERCHADIPWERLEIRPYARYCVPCQQAVSS